MIVRSREEKKWRLKKLIRVFKALFVKFRDARVSVVSNMVRAFSMNVVEMAKGVMP